MMYQIFETESYNQFNDFLANLEIKDVVEIRTTMVSNHQRYSGHSKQYLVIYKEKDNAIHKKEVVA